ncbi:MAG: UDP-N-acetylglucosamine 1-carboxyvinyltransferase [Limisphaerales bacterium]
MESLLIKGGTRLKGEVRISGAKNTVLPIMAGALLTREKCIIKNTPDLRDVRTMCRILQSLGATVERSGGTISIHADKITGVGDYDLIRQMRGSICILGPLLGRLGKAKVSLPGGCVIGVRPIDLHLKGLKALGAKTRTSGGYVHVSGPKLKGTEMFLGGRAGPTVLGTINIIMAAALADGVTVIDSAACEPEVMDACDFLTSMGAKIEGAGSPTIRVTGVKKLHGTTHTVIPDRIEAATYAIAAAATNGEVTLKGCRPEHLQAVIDKLWEAGVQVEKRGKNLWVKRGRKLKSVDVTTQPYSGFPTDVQAQMMALMVQTNGLSIITERIFESRFGHVSELGRLGADIAIEGPSAIVKGGLPLSGAQVMASDLRASAALVIAGLCAKGTTQVNRIYHLDRGYENLDEKFQKLGAEIQRIDVKGP